MTTAATHIYNACGGVAIPCVAATLACYETHDTCDYVHVNDIADAHVRGLKHLLDGGNSCALNLANSRGYSVKEVIAAAERVCGHAIPSQAAARRPGDPPVLIGDASRAHTLLSWEPTGSDLETQIRDSWNWIQQR